MHESKQCTLGNPTAYTHTHTHKCTDMCNPCTLLFKTHEVTEEDKEVQKKTGNETKQPNKPATIGNRCG